MLTIFRKFDERKSYVKQISMTKFRDGKIVEICVYVCMCVRVVLCVKKCVHIRFEWARIDHRVMAVDVPRQKGNPVTKVYEWYPSSRSIRR